jgi:DNA polymerase I-like protein with 3'-5' exonuclease and polymerase domains
MFALDEETSTTVGDLSNGYALEPWRVRQGKAFVSSIACVSDDGFSQNTERPNRHQLIELLEKLAGQEVYCHNAIFDVAWIIASINPDKTKPVPQVVRNVRWRDTMLLAKWVVNGQGAEDNRFSYSLLNLVRSYLTDKPGTAEFIAMKEKAVIDPSNAYWLQRGLMDAIKTLELAKFLEGHLKPEQRRGYLIEQRNIPFIANSWLVGVNINESKLLLAERHYIDERARHLADLKNMGETVSIEALSSPTQMQQIIYGRWQLPVIEKTPSGGASTAEDTIKILAYQTKDPRLLKVVEAKKCTTLLSKYINTAKLALSRTGDGCFYGVPKIFGANTGRFTMSNSTMDKRDDMKVSTAMHQIPRKAPHIRDYMEAPPGMKLMEADAVAQEFNIMAIWSRDENMIKIRNQGIDPHAWMAGEIYGMPWEAINEARKRKDKAAEEKRQNGKLLNLSSNFRIGGKAYARKSFTEYDQWMSEQDGYSMQSTFKRAYPGVPKYWDSIIHFARTNGYTYTLAQRRFKIHKWGGRDTWKSEGIAISTPIQGTAAEHLHATMTACHDHVMMTTLHDATFFAVSGEDEAKEIDAKMNSVNYEQMWNVELPVALPFEHKIGNSFKDVK